MCREYGKAKLDRHKKGRNNRPYAQIGTKYFTIRWLVAVLTLID